MLPRFSFNGGPGDQILQQATHITLSIERSGSGWDVGFEINGSVMFRRLVRKDDGSTETVEQPDSDALELCQDILIALAQRKGEGQE